MNLMLADVSNARRVLRSIGIEPEKVTYGWHNGNLSIIVDCSQEKSEAVQEIISKTTAINIPIAIKPSFRFNFS